MKIRILDLAERDLEDGTRFYERQSPGLGGYFLDSVASDIASLARTAGVHRIVYGHHQLLARKFPYAIYYRMVDGDVLVDAVVDCRRDPKWIGRRMKTR